MKNLLSYDFQLVQEIEPVRDRYGKVQEFYPLKGNLDYESSAIHKYGNGPFCRFSIDPSKWNGVSGVYAFFIDGELVYIGQALNLAQRFNQGYGYISTRSCLIGGHSTNCKINQVVLETVRDNKNVELYFCTTGDFHRIERELIGHFNPMFNSSLRTDRNQSANVNSTKTHNISCTDNKKPRGSTSNPSVHEVRKYIQNQIMLVKSQGKNELVVRSGEIHNALNMVSAMPTVCSAMRTLPADYKYVVIDQPPKGNGSRLVFKYIF